MSNATSSALPSSSFGPPRPGSAEAPTLAHGNSNANSSSDSSDSSDSSNTKSSSVDAHSELLQRVVQGAHRTIDDLAATAAPHVHLLEEGMTTAGDALSQKANHMREIGDEWTESLRSTVRENPIAALATAVVVGMLVSHLTRR